MCVRHNLSIGRATRLTRLLIFSIVEMSTCWHGRLEAERCERVIPLQTFWATTLAVKVVRRQRANTTWPRRLWKQDKDTNDTCTRLNGTKAPKTSLKNFSDNRKGICSGWFRGGEVWEEKNAPCVGGFFTKNRQMAFTYVDNCSNFTV